MKDKLIHVGGEIRNHLPYTIFSTALGLVLIGMLTFIAQLLNQSEFPQAASGLFHVFHPIHILLSAAATTTMFWTHERRIFRALIIGFIGSVGICSLSDILMPYVSGLLLDVEMELHLCILDHPESLLPFVITGLIAGLVASNAIEKSTFFSHSSHVLVSSMASILYLISYGLHGWMAFMGSIFVYMVLAVLIPCCISDIAFPLFFVKTEEEEVYEEEEKIEVV